MCITEPWCSLQHLQHLALTVSVFRPVCAFKEVTLYSNNSTRSECGASWQTDLQVEAGAFRHGGEGWDGCHRGQGTHQHKDTPAVELVGWTHLEAPAYMRKKCSPFTTIAGVYLTFCATNWCGLLQTDREINVQITVILLVIPRLVLDNH